MADSKQKPNKNGKTRQSRVLTTEEANRELLQHSITPDYHFDEIDEMVGIEYEARFEETKNGKKVLVQESNLGGFYYLGSLIIFLVLSIAAASGFYGAYESFIDKDISTMVQGIVISVILLAADGWAFNSLVKDIRAKREYKTKVKQGVIPKKKLTYGIIVARYTVICFVLFMCYGLFGLVGSNVLGIDVPPQGFLILAALYLLGTAILSINFLIGVVKETAKGEKHADR